MTSLTERIAIAQLLLSFTHVVPMMALQIVWVIAEHTPSVVTVKDELAEGSPISTTIMRIILEHSRSLLKKKEKAKPI
jgi:hypothetical protein